MNARAEPRPGLLTPPDVRALAQALNLRPTKARGQNFLIDPNTVRRIVRTAQVGPDDVVLEIGPGLGSLTLGLLAAARRVVAVEVDPVLAAALPATVGARLGEGPVGKLRLLAADGLSLTAAGVEAAAGVPPDLLVANLPYNVAVPLLLGLLERLASLRGGLVMVQAEVADRLTALPGGRVYGVPSVKLAWWARPRPAGTIGRAVFWPRPNVDSALVGFSRREPPGDERLRSATFEVVDAAFAQRRKTLRSALAGWAGSADRSEAVLRAAGVDPAARGETLDLEGFVAIARAAAAGDGPAGS